MPRLSLAVAGVFWVSAGTAVEGAAALAAGGAVLAGSGLVEAKIHTPLGTGHVNFDGDLLAGEIGFKRDGALGVSGRGRRVIARIRKRMKERGMKTTPFAVEPRDTARNGLAS
jgi:hypothetical protein